MQLSNMQLSDTVCIWRLDIGYHQVTSLPSSVNILPFLLSASLRDCSVDFQHADKFVPGLLAFIGAVSEEALAMQ